ncbi:MAG: Sapep family Mn(2+)-dependent dipeptidase [Clostridia bacterium]|nr:Sapep family Mn(2+)-dependent dipeptidase [Clostridia bacterium]
MVNMNYDTKIKDWLDEHKDEILEKWMKLAAIPSIKGRAEEGAPFGKACAEALQACSDMFGEYGFESGLYSGNRYALASLGNGEKNIGIFSHSDVVPVNEEDWIFTKPFEPKIVDGTLIGRGVEDNKSGVMAALCAMRIIRECEIPLKSRIVTFVGSEEETGMSDIRAFAEEQTMPDVSLVPDADFPCSIGEKGIFHFWAKSDATLCDIVEFKGGEAFNIVLDKAVVKLKNNPELKAELEERINGKEQFLLEERDGLLVLTAKGIAKHACEPEGSVNAAYLAAELLSDVDGLANSDREVVRNMKKILACPFGTSMGIDHDDIRFGKLTFVNGMVDVEKGKLKLSFDTRYGSTLEPEELEKNVFDSFGALGWKIEINSHSKGFSIADDSPIPSALEKVYAAVTGFEKQAIRLGGGTYARIIENAFSVGTFTMRADRDKPFMELPAGHGGAHQADEKIDIEGFFDAVRVLTQYIINIDEIISLSK